MAEAAITICDCVGALLSETMLLPVPMPVSVHFGAAIQVCPNERVHAVTVPVPIVMTPLLSVPLTEGLLPQLVAEPAAASAASGWLMNLTVPLPLPPKRQLMLGSLPTQVISGPKVAAPGWISTWLAAFATLVTSNCVVLSLPSTL